MASEKNQNSKNRPRRDQSSVSNDNPTKDSSHSITMRHRRLNHPLQLINLLESSTSSPKQKTTVKSTPKIYAYKKITTDHSFKNTKESIEIICIYRYEE